MDERLWLIVPGIFILVYLIESFLTWSDRRYAHKEATKRMDKKRRSQSVNTSRG